MCTVTWLARAEGYQLFFNRDEARLRAVAEPPRQVEVDGVRALAPRDGEAGGTWLAVNEHGVSVALLNAHARREPEGEPHSRGGLVQALAAATDVRAGSERLRALDLTRYRGFRLLLAAPPARPTFGAAGAAESGEPRLALWSWDGLELAEEAPVMPVASSSLGSERAHASRAAVLEELAREGLDAATLERFHASHAPERGPWSPCVHRPDVVTLSACHVQVDEDEVRLRYAAGSPCVTPFGPALSLARRAARSR